MGLKRYTMLDRFGTPEGGSQSSSDRKKKQRNRQARAMREPYAVNNLTKLLTKDRLKHRRELKRFHSSLSSSVAAIQVPVFNLDDVG